MDLRKRIDRLEKVQSAVHSPIPTPQHSLEIRELSVEEWNERYVDPFSDGALGQSEIPYDSTKVEDG